MKGDKAFPFTAILMCLTILGCSSDGPERTSEQSNARSTERPSNAVLEAAIRSSLPDIINRYGIRGSMILCSQNTKVEDVEILDVGRMQDESALGGGIHWPVRARVQASCEWVNMLAGRRMERREFDNRWELSIGEDPYGDWVVQYGQVTG